MPVSDYFNYAGSLVSHILVHTTHNSVRHEQIGMGCRTESYRIYGLGICLKQIVIVQNQNLRLLYRYASLLAYQRQLS